MAIDIDLTKSETAEAGRPGGWSASDVDHRQRNPIATELRSPHFRVTMLRLGVLCFTLGVLCVAWELISGQHSVILASAAVMSVIVPLVRGQLQPRMVPDLTSLVVPVVASVTIATALSLLGNMVITGRSVNGAWLVRIYAAVLIAALVGLFIGVYMVRRLWKHNRLRSSALIVGTSGLSLEFGIEIAHRRVYGVDVIGMVGPETGHGPIPRLGNYEDLPKLVEMLDIDRLIIIPGSTSELVGPIRWANFRAGLDVFVVPRFYELGNGIDSVSPDRVRGFPVSPLTRTTYRACGMFAKRSFDAAVAGTVLLLASPVLSAIWVALKISSPSESALFRQERIGRNGEPFEILKFRSMTTSTKSDQEWMGEADARVTRLGNFLRKSSLDEVPQFLNVLKGDMSLVGPRPERPYYVDQFSGTVPGYAERHRMPVGLTGLAQIVGLRGDTSIEQRVKYDNIYIDQWRFVWDLEILVKTAWAVVRAGSYADDAKIVEEQVQQLSARG